MCYFLFWKNLAGKTTDPGVLCFVCFVFPDEIYDNKIIYLFQIRIFIFFISYCVTFCKWCFQRIRAFIKAFKIFQHKVIYYILFSSLMSTGSVVVSGIFISLMSNLHLLYVFPDQSHFWFVNF